MVLVFLSGFCALIQGLLTGPLDEQTDGYDIELIEVVAPDEVLWIDARSLEAYRKSHYAGAYHLTMDDWQGGLAEFLPAWEPGRLIIVYCDGATCDSSRTVAERLRAELGSNNVRWLPGGWEALGKWEVAHD